MAYLDVISPPTFIVDFDFVENLSFLPWNYDIAHCHILQAQTAQANEEPPSESSLDLTLT